MGLKLQLQVVQFLVRLSRYQISHIKGGVTYDYTTIFFVISLVPVGALPRKPREGLIAAPSTPASVFFIVLGSALGRWTGAGPAQDRRWTGAGPLAHR